MPTGVVEANGFSQSHKPVVTIGGQRYSASRCEPPVNTLQVGDKIEFDSNSGQYQGKTIWYLNSWKLLEGAKKYLDPNRTTPAPMDIPAPHTPVSAYSQDCIKFCSNVVGNVFGAQVLTPEDIEKWLSAAKNAYLNQFK